MNRSIENNPRPCSQTCSAGPPIECSGLIYKDLFATLVYPDFPGSLGTVSTPLGWIDSMEAWSTAVAFDAIPPCDIDEFNIYVSCNIVNGLTFFEVSTFIAGPSGGANWVKRGIPSGSSPFVILTDLELLPGYNLCPEYFVPGTVSAYITQ